MIVTNTECPRRWAAVAAVVVLLVAGAGPFAQPARGRSIVVGPTSSDERPDLATALQVAAEGDTLLLEPGLYRGGHTLTSGVSLLGVAGPDSTILDADGERYVLYGRDIDRTTVIAGLTLQNGRRDHPNSGGGGIYLYQSSPSIVNCVFRNHLGYLGPGVYANHRSHPVIAYCVFHDNEGYLGGAIAAYVDCDPLIYNNVIYDNTAVSGGAILALNSTPVIVGNTIVANTASDGGGGAIYLDSSPALIEQNVIALCEGSGAVFCIDADRPATVRGNLLWRNSDESARSKCPPFQGLDGNHEADPLFEDLEGRLLWRPADAPGAPPAAGAAPWNPGEPPAVPPAPIDQWRAWRDAQKSD